MALTRGGLQRAINSVEKFCTKWEMKINVRKSKILIGKKGPKPKRSEEWYIGNEIIEVVQPIKYLGVNINFNGGWTTQNKNSVRIGRNALSIIDSCRHNLPDLNIKIAKKNL